MPSRSSGTCGRFSRSSIATGSSLSRWPAFSSCASRRARGVERGDGGRAADRDAVPVGGVQQAFQRQALDMRGGEDDQRRQPPLLLHLVEHRGDLVRGAEDGVALDAPPGLARPHRQDADDAEGRLPFGREGTDEDVGAVAGADQQHRLRGDRFVRPAGMVQPAGDARRAQQQAEGQRMDRREGGVGRDPGVQHMQPGPEQHRGADGGADDPQQVGQAGIAPVLLRQPHRQAGGQQGQRRAGQGAEPPGLIRPGAGRVQQHGRRQGQAGDEGIQREVEQDAMRRAAGHPLAIGRTAPRRHRPPPLRRGQRREPPVQRDQPRRLRVPAVAGGGGRAGPAAPSAARRAGSRSPSTAAAMAAGSALSTSTPQPAARRMPATSAAKAGAMTGRPACMASNSLCGRARRWFSSPGWNSTRAISASARRAMRLGVRQPGQPLDRGGRGRGPRRGPGRPAPSHR